LAPIDHSTSERPAAKRRAAASMSPAGTPQTCSARSGVHSRATARASSQPVVLARHEVAVDEVLAVEHAEHRVE